MKKYIYAVLAALTVAFLAWVAGFDFDERSPLALLVAWTALGSAAVAFCCGRLEELS